jgi:hypothetical protein
MNTPKTAGILPARPKILVLGATGGTGRLIVREALARGFDVRALVRSPGKASGLEGAEIIAFEPESKVTFFQATGPREGAVINELFEDESGELQLRFYGYLGLRGKMPGGPEEQAEQAWMDGEQGYKTALLSTLKRTRELLAQGEL